MNLLITCVEETCEHSSDPFSEKLAYTFAYHPILMSTDTPDNSTEPMIEYIPDGVNVKIDISAGYYQRIQNLTAFLMENRTPQELQLAKEIIEGTEKDMSKIQPWMVHYETVMMFWTEFERVARVEGKTKSVPQSQLPEELQAALKG